MDVAARLVLCVSDFFVGADFFAGGDLPALTGAAALPAVLTGVDARTNGRTAASADRTVRTGLGSFRGIDGKIGKAPPPAIAPMPRKEGRARQREQIFFVKSGETLLYSTGLR